MQLGKKERFWIAYNKAKFRWLYTSRIEVDEIAQILKQYVNPSQHIFIHSSSMGLGTMNIPKLCSELMNLVADGSDILVASPIVEGYTGSKIKRLPGSGGSISEWFRKKEMSIGWNVPHRIISVKGLITGQVFPKKKWSMESGYGLLLNENVQYITLGLNPFFLPTVFHIMELDLKVNEVLIRWSVDYEYRSLDYTRRTNLFEVLRLKRYLRKVGVLSVVQKKGVRIEYYEGIDQNLLANVSRLFKVYSS